MIEQDLNEIPNEKIKRFVGDKDGQLLCFCDASAKAYATCVYLRCVKDNEVATNLIFSKSRIC